MSYAARAIEAGTLVAIVMLLLIAGGDSFKIGKQDGKSVVLTKAAETANAQSPDLEERRLELRMRINNALRSGQLSPTQALEFREQLAANANAQMQYTKNGPLSFGQAQQLLSDLSTLDSELQSAMAVNSSSVQQRRPTVSTAEVDSMKAYISDRLERARWGGQLGRAQFDALRNYLDQIDNHEAALTNHRGVIAFAAQRHLLSQLNELDARITQEMNNSLAGRSTTFWY